MGKCLSCHQESQTVVNEHCSNTFNDVIHHSVQDLPINKSDMCQHPCTEINKAITIDKVINNLEGTSDKFVLSVLNNSCIDNQSTHFKEISEKNIIMFFDQYKDAHENAILTEGIEKFCEDLNMMLDDFRVLLLAWKFNAKQMFCFTEEEFVNGCQNLKVDCIADIQSKFPELIAEIEIPDKFKDLYRFTFCFALERDQRVLHSEMAIQLWKLVFSLNEPPILERWLNFLARNPSIRGISRDTWNMFLNFAESVHDDLSSYDDTAAWPSLFDDFVEYENDQTNQNVCISLSKEKSVLDA